MVDSIKPTYVPIRPTFDRNRVRESTDIQSNADGVAGQDYIVTRDRRKRKDRRSSRAPYRGSYDMRSGRGRRKDDARPNIEIKV